MADDSSNNDGDQQQQRVLSIQSHVVSGYVGNKAAVFPLQLLGFEVDVINSVHFSNHTGYPAGVTGDVLKGEQLLDLWQGLKNNNLHNCSHLLTGYIGSESFLLAVLEIVQEYKQMAATTSDNNTTFSFRYICDPVLGDGGKFYVPLELVQVYRERVLPLADVVTPNQFEAEQLTGMSKLGSMSDALEACRRLHNMGPKLVVLTSVEFGNKNDSDSNDNNVMSMIASCMDDNSTTTTPIVYKVDCPVIPGQFTGTGDLCAALLLAHTAMHPLPHALELVANTMAAVIERTHTMQQKQQHNSNSNSNNDCPVYAKELKLIQSKRDIENPVIKYKAERIQ